MLLVSKKENTYEIPYLVITKAFMNIHFHFKSSANGKSKFSQFFSSISITPPDTINFITSEEG